MAKTRIGSDLSIAQLEEILEGRRGALVKLERKRAKLVAQLDALDTQIVELGGARSGGSRARNEKSLTQTMISVLQAKGGGPMRVADIANAVIASGYKTTSDNFRGIVNQTLIKEKHFLQHERGSYQLRKSAMDKA